MADCAMGAAGAENASAVLMDAFAKGIVNAAHRDSNFSGGGQIVV